MNTAKEMEKSFHGTIRHMTVIQDSPSIAAAWHNRFFLKMKNRNKIEVE
jgi:hypothetical protein